MMAFAFRLSFGTLRADESLPCQCARSSHEIRGELFVAVQDEESLAEQKAVDRFSEISTDLHPKGSGGRGS